MNINITPLDAGRHGCTASATLVRSKPVVGDVENFYSLSAQAAVGWRFAYFIVKRTEFSHVEGRDITYVKGPYHIDENPTESGVIFDGNYDFRPGMDYYGNWELELTAVFEQLVDYAEVSVSVDPAEAGTATGGGEYIVGSVCTISTEESGPDWEFLHWDLSPGGRHESKEHSFRVSVDTDCVAVYRKRPYLINASASASPQAAAKAGCTADADPPSQEGELGDEASITFTAKPADGWTFVSWSDGSTDAIHTVTETFGPERTKTLSLVAEFRKDDPGPGPTYEIFASGAVSPDDARLALCRASVSPDYASGSLGDLATFTFTANPSNGWEFVSWSDGSTDDVHSVSVPFGPELQKDFELTATFRRKSSLKYKVSVSTSPQNAGVATGGGEFDAGATCTIGTSPRCSPWIFDRWELTPGGTVQSKEHSFTVNGDTDCIAYYKHTNTQKPYHDTNGNVLCSRSGNILYDGDAV